MKDSFKRASGFLGIPILSAIAPFMALPVITRTTEHWSSINTALTIGALGAVGVLFGWGTFGPATVAIQPPNQKALLYRESLIVRMIMFAVMTPLSIGITALIVESQALGDSILMTISMTSTGLLPSWYFIGLGEPLKLAIYDVAPRLVATILSFPIILSTQTIWSYPLFTIIAIILSVTVFSIKELKKVEENVERISITSLFSKTKTIAISDLVANSYGSTPSPIATASLNATTADSFNSADKAYRIGLSLVVVGLGNAFQAWTLNPEASTPRHRHIFAIMAHSIAGIIGGALLTFLGPWATSLFFGEAVAATQSVCMWYGFSFFFISFSTPLIRNLLMPHGRKRFLLMATAVSSVVGLALMVLASLQGSAEGIAMGMAISEVVLVGILLGPAVRLIPSIKSLQQ